VRSIGAGEKNREGANGLFAQPASSHCCSDIPIRPREAVEAVGLVSRYEDMSRQRSGLTKDEIANLPCERPGCNKKLGPGRVDRLYCSESCRMKKREMDRARYKRAELLEKLCNECQEILGLNINGGAAP